MVRQIQVRRRKGVVLLLYTMMMLFVILPVVGLAIDVSVLLAIKSKMQTAADGAALAAGRSLSRGMTIASQQSAATDTATRFYRMNIENGFLGLQATDPAVTFPTAPLRTILIQVDSTVQAPTYFLRVIGYNSTTLTTRSTTSRRFVNIMMVIDRSGSLGSACAQVQTAASQFAKTFVNGQDKMGLVTFGTSYRTDLPLTSDFLAASTGVPDLIKNLVCVGGTNAAAAYWKAYQQLSALNEEGALNVILFFTDGLPNTIHMPSLEIKSTSSCTDKTSLRDGVIAATTGSKAAGLFVGVQTHAPGSGISPDTTFISNSSGCSYTGNYTNIDNDLVAITRTGQPEVDIFGTLLTGWKSVSRDSSGRISVSNSNATNAGINALVNAAHNSRINTNLNVITYAIGLGEDIDEDVLNRVANAPETLYYDAGQAAGKYIYAADGAQLQTAFAQLASEVLRISQ
jgi:Flp pilus assembly protein TadG